MISVVTTSIENNTCRHFLIFSVFLELKPTSQCEDFKVNLKVTLCPHPITKCYGLEKCGYHQERMKEVHGLNCSFSGLGKQVIDS